ncbi:MAG: LLM class flavin-dependent oxidoreductase [Myxococcota bacterium]
MSAARFRFGIFMAPFHPVDENPTLSLQRDFELIEWLDRLGFDEAWIGEHHSAGYEIISSPELFIAAAAERTRRIRLGTGVVSLPYHGPLAVAGRMNQLDHMTQGRCMFGVGPGLLPSDAFMQGIDPRRQRDRMVEALSAILPLMRGETVTMKTDWFELNEARVQLSPYTLPQMEVCVASSVSPSGPRTAGRFGIGILSPGATSSEGFDALKNTWGIWREQAEKHGNTADRSGWRLAAPVHVAETREQARENVRFGLTRWRDYFETIGGLPIAGDGSDDPVEALVESGMGVIGTPDDAIALIERLQERSGGFGCFLQIAHEWANRQATLESYELFARYVIPHFQGTNRLRQKSLDWARDNRETFIGAAMQGVMEAVQKHAAEAQSGADGND